MSPTEHNHAKKRSQSVQLRRRLLEGVVVEGVDITIGAPVFVPKDAPGCVQNCRFHFLGDRPRIGMTFTRRGVWLGAYVGQPKSAQDNVVFQETILKGMWKEELFDRP